MNYEIIDNVLPKDSFEFISDYMKNSSIWNLDMTSDEGSAFIPGRVLYDEQLDIREDLKETAVLSFVFSLIRDKSKSPLSRHLKRIHIGAKPPLIDDKIHTDSRDGDYTVLYYTNKTWSKSWGGQTIVDGKKVDYVPNRAVIYKSDVPHGGKGPTYPVLRTYVNYVVKGK